MNYKFFIILSLIALCSCQNKKDAKSVSKEHKVKSIHFEEFSLIDISSNAQNDLQSWKSFQSLMQVIVGMAPTKIKNTENLVNSHPDSLLIYKRLPAQNPQTVLENAAVERDWRTVKGVQDTVFRLEKKNGNEVSYIQWNHFLVENVPYTFSIFVKDLGIFDFGLNFVHNEKIIVQDVWKIRKETDSVLTSLKKEDLNVRTPKLVDEQGIPTGEAKDFDIRTMPILEIKTETILLDNDWREFRIPFIPEKSDVYGIRMGFRKDAKQKDIILFYRPTLQIRAKDFFKMGEYSDKIVQEQSTVESSYYSVFFWLRQIEDELKQLLADDQSFPEKIKANAIKARFRLFETQVKELADNVKNNPDFQESEVKSHIKKLQNTFNDIILHINKFYDSDLDERMKHISTQVDTLTETATNNVPMLHTETEKQSDTK